MSTHALQTAAADEVEPRDSASLDILVKALMAGLATILTARISAQAVVVAAVLATLAAEGVKQFVKRRNWGIKRVGFLVALTMLLGSIDSKVARGARKALGGSSHVLDVFGHGAAQVVLTTTAATAITVSAVTVPELATGRSILSDRDSTFFSHQKSDNLTIRGTEGTLDIGPGQLGRLLFEANAGERLFVEVTDSNIGATTLSLQDPDGVQVGYATYAYDFLDTRQLPATGTYSVVLDPLARLSGRATVRVLRVPPDAIETALLSEEAQPVTFNTTIGQNAKLEFEGKAGDRVFVEITDSNIGTTTLSVRDPAGNELPGATYAYNFLDTQRLSATGTYKAVLDPWNNNSGRASVRITRD
jgi:hypothetical protein